MRFWIWIKLSGADCKPLKMLNMSHWNTTFRSSGYSLSIYISGDDQEQHFLLVHDDRLDQVAKWHAKKKHGMNHRVRLIRVHLSHSVGWHEVNRYWNQIHVLSTLHPLRCWLSLSTWTEIVTEEKIDSWHSDDFNILFCTIRIKKAISHNEPYVTMCRWWRR